MAKSYEQLKQQAAVIKNEKEKGANTAQRIGTMFEDLTDFANEQTGGSGGGGVGKVDPNSDGTGEIFNDYTNNKATGRYSSSHGSNTKANNENEFSVGTYNYSKAGETEDQQSIFSVGCGHAYGVKNGITVMRNGDVYILNLTEDSDEDQLIGTCLQLYLKSITSFANKADEKKLILNTKGSTVIFQNSTNDNLSENANGFVYGNKSKITGYGSSCGGTNHPGPGGGYRTASGYGSHAGGFTYMSSATIEASGDGSYAVGYAKSYTMTASGDGSVVQGYALIGNSEASGDGSHSQNISTIANSYGQTAIGCRNEAEETASPTSYDATKAALIIGNGTSSAAGNAFKVLFNGQTYADGEYSSAGADYAEMFEWKDGNPLNEDRVGRFVTLKGKNIEIANETSTYILGIVSGAPTIIGDNPMRWQGKYLNDEWGRPIYEDIEVTYTEYERQVDGTFKEVEKTRIDHVRKLNPLYNAKEKYVPRAERKEWDFIGMMGKLLVKQDGTLIEDGFCKSGANGIATASDSGYYVMEVINNSQALILFR